MTTKKHIKPENFFQSDNLKFCNNDYSQVRLKDYKNTYESSNSVF
jgi:hypothetical protein